MLLYEHDYHFPHYNSLGDYYQDDNFGNYVTVELDTEQAILFITEDLH